jgi:hypothetical protein
VGVRGQDADCVPTTYRLQRSVGWDEIPCRSVPALVILQMGVTPLSGPLWVGLNHHSLRGRPVCTDDDFPTSSPAAPTPDYWSLRQPIRTGRDPEESWSPPWLLQSAAAVVRQAPERPAAAPEPPAAERRTPELQPAPGEALAAGPEPEPEPELRAVEAPAEVATRPAPYPERYLSQRLP